MNLKVYSGGIRLVIYVRSAGRCEKGYVLTRRASLVRSYKRDSSAHSKGKKEEV